MHTTFMQGVAVNGEDGRHSSFQAPRLLPVSLFQLFSHFAHPPPPRHLHAAVEFSLPFFIFPFPPNFSHMVLQLICRVVLSVSPRWGCAVLHADEQTGAVASTQKIKSFTF